MNHQADIHRFLSYVSVPIEQDGCWIWNGGRDKDGYGRFHLYTETKRESRATAAAYILFVGPVPNGLQICHSCDTPWCVNPSHLWLGTDQQNVADMVKKGRQSKGEKHHKAKLTDAQVAEILVAYIPRAGGMPKGFGPSNPAPRQAGSPRQLAKKYGVTRSAITYIIRKHR